MPYILPLKGFTPKLGENCFIAVNATIVGDVIMGNDCSIWFNAVVRGDVNSIIIGNKVIMFQLDKMPLYMDAR